MADRVLLRGIHLRRGPGIAFRHKDRVVTEAVRAAGRRGEPTHQLARSHPLDGRLADRGRFRSGHHQRGRADEPGTAAGWRHVHQLGQHERQVSPIVPMASGPACGQHPRHPVQRIDAEPGIVCDRGHAGEHRYRTSLEQRVLLERAARLRNVGRAWPRGEAHQVHDGSIASRGENPGQLGDLVRIPGGEHHALRLGIPGMGTLRRGNHVGGR